MNVRRIRLQDFRNVPGASLEFPGRRCFFVGDNGQGKTNLLESIGYVSALRAFRPGDNRVLIREGASEAAIAITIEHERLRESEVLVRIRPRGKEAVFDGSPVRRLGDIIGRFPTVLFASEDIQLMRGAPGLRRRFLDLHLASLEPGYLEVLQQYHRALEQRNRLLKTDGASTRELAAFEQQLAQAASGVLSRRRAGVARLAGLVREAYASIADGSEEGTVAYRPDLDILDTDDMLAALDRYRTRDLHMKSTQHGPHRDDLALQVDGRDAALYASEGQQRALVLAMRFSQLRDARARTGVTPVVLADDVLGELDPDRRRRFWAALDPDVQLFATGTALPADVDDTWQVFQVRSGRFVPAAKPA